MVSGAGYRRGSGLSGGNFLNCGGPVAPWQLRGASAPWPCATQAADVRPASGYTSRGGVPVQRAPVETTANFPSVLPIRALIRALIRARLG